MEPDPDRALFFSGFQDKFFLLISFCRYQYLTIIYQSLKITSTVTKKSQNGRRIKVFLSFFLLLMEGSVSER